MNEVKVYVQQVRETVTTPHYVAFPYFVAESFTSHLNPLVSCYWDTEIVHHCVSRLPLGSSETCQQHQKSQIEVTYEKLLAAQRKLCDFQRFHN